MKARATALAPEVTQPIYPTDIRSPAAPPRQRPFTGRGEVRKDVQGPRVKRGNRRHCAVIAAPALLAPPEE